jgi:hypothetical protein
MLGFGTIGAKAAGAIARLIGQFGSSGPISGTWTAGDIAPDSTGSFWVCTIGGTPGTWMRLGKSMVFDIRDFMPTSTPTSNDTSYIAAAIAAAQAVSTPDIKFQNGSGTFQGGLSTSGAGIVWVPHLAKVTNIVGGHRVHIASPGWGAGFYQIASSTGPVYTNRRDGSVHAKYTGLQNMAIIGNKANQSSSTNHGVLLQGEPANDYQNALDEDYDECHHINNVYIWNTKGDGLRMTGSGGNQIVGLKIRGADGNGLYSFQDNDITNCDIGWSGLRGVFIDGDDCRLSCVKAWYSGQVTPASGQGFYITSDSGTISDCSAQDNTAHGFLWEGAYGWSGSALMADSNSKGSAGTYAQFSCYNSQNNNIEGTARNRYNVGGPGTVALEVAGAGPAPLQNKITINPGTGVWGVSTLLKSGSVVDGNEVTFGANSDGFYEVAYSATITPNPLQARRWRIGTVTGNLTLANPPWKWPGAVIEVWFKVNATGGYTFALGSDWDSSITLNNTANTVNKFRAVYSATSGKWEPWG